MRHKILILTLLCLLSLPALAEETGPTLPAVVQAQTKALEPIGSGNYHKFGFRVYRVTLWAKNKNWDPNQPYALQLKYARSVDKETLVDTVVDDIREQKVADDQTLTHWKSVLSADLPAVEEDDELIGLAMPGKKSLLFFNGKQIASIDDQALSKAFFNVWLGDTADEDLKAKLLGKEE